MVYGVGIDLVEISKFKRMFEKHSERWIKRGAHETEIKASPLKTQKKRYFEYWAARFAVKEAFAKALGTGLGKEWNTRELGVVKTKLGKPQLKVEDELKKKLKSLRITGTHVSITHTDAYAIALVVLEKNHGKRNSK